MSAALATPCPASARVFADLPDARRAIVAERFWNRVERAESGCWIWRGQRSRAGYGQTKVGAVAVLAHRLAYEISNGPIPDGLCVLHSCDVPACVNPMHLRVGSQMENVRDRESRRRTSCGERHADVVRRSWADPASQHRRGSAHPRAKLNEKTVTEIRGMCMAGIGARRIAARFGVSRTLVRKVLAGEIWRHVK